MNIQTDRNEAEVLRQVRVRLLDDAEVDKFNELIVKHHYLASHRFAGQSIRYVAEIDGEWVALLCFSAASLHIKAREQWIGWTPDFDSIIGGWLIEQVISAVERLAIDGKVLRGISRSDGKPIHLLSAVTHRLRLTLGQIAVHDKSNEIPAFPKLLYSLKIREGFLVTTDAMHCQQESARTVTEDLNSDYIFGLKRNQSGILEYAQLLLEQEVSPPAR